MNCRVRTHACRVVGVTDRGEVEGPCTCGTWHHVPFLADACVLVHGGLGVGIRLCLIWDAAVCACGCVYTTAIGGFGRSVPPLG